MQFWAALDTLGSPPGVAVSSTMNKAGKGTV